MARELIRRATLEDMPILLEYTIEQENLWLLVEM